MFDLAITNGLIVNGNREQPFTGTVYIKAGKIAQICADPTLPAATSIDAGGRVVAPGFIDIHGHSDLGFLATPSLAGKLLQGVTFELNGLCGLSAIPMNDQNRAQTLRSVGSDMGLSFDTARFTATDFTSYRDAAM